MNDFIKIQVIRGFTEIKPVWNLLSKFEGKAFICGGYVRYMCSPNRNPVIGKDLDIYCQSDDIYNDIKAELIKKLSIKHESGVAITFKIAEEGEFKYVPSIQLIKPINQGAIVAKGTIEEVLSNFDFSVVRIGLISENEAIADIDFEKDETDRILKLKNIHCPISSTARCIKYGKKGYRIRLAEIVKLFADWDNRDEEYVRKITEGIETLTSGEEMTEEEKHELYSLLNID